MAEKKWCVAVGQREHALRGYLISLMRGSSAACGVCHSAVSAFWMRFDVNPDYGSAVVFCHVCGDFSGGSRMRAADLDRSPLIEMSEVARRSGGKVGSVMLNDVCVAMGLD